MVRPRSYALVKPNYRFNGLAKKEWQVFTWQAAAAAPDRVAYGRNSRMIFSGTQDECLAVLAGCTFYRKEYRTGRLICPGHYTRAGVATVTIDRPGNKGL